MQAPGEVSRTAPTGYAQLDEPLSFTLNFVALEHVL